MDEFEFISSIQQKYHKQSSLIKGIGDDAAVFRQSYQDTVTAVDTMVDGIHFSRQTMFPFHIGYRALAANISDMAAMGAKPAYYLVSIVIPKDWSDQQLKEIFLGMDALASEHQMDLIGGDTVSGKQLVLSITIIGFVHKDKARYRRQAQNGDIIFVTGTLGDSAAGLHVLLNSELDQQKFSDLINKHRMPTPRVAFANQLSPLSRVALNDISDGIASEASELAEASNMTMNLIYDKLPFHKDLLLFSSDDRKKWILSGGEDFELIGTVSKKDWPTVQQAAECSGTQITQIGFVSNHHTTNGSVILHEQDTIKKLQKSGYTHLK